jgi:hypothetical protein
MYRIYAIVGFCALALAVVIAVTTCRIAQPPTDNAGPAQHAQ